jgi:hypothetical protein
MGVGALPDYYSMQDLTAGADNSGSTTGGGGGGVASDSSSALTGLSGMFSSIGNAISSTYRAVNPVVNTPQGAVLYNPSTGRYTTPQGIYATQQSAALSPIILLGLGALVLFMLLKD